MLGTCSSPTQLPKRDSPTVARAMLQAFPWAHWAGGVGRAGLGCHRRAGQGRLDRARRSWTSLGWAGCGAGKKPDARGDGELH